MSNLAREWQDSFPDCTPHTFIDDVGREVPHINKFSLPLHEVKPLSNDEIPRQQETDLTEKNPTFPEVDQFINDRADEFFGMRALASTPISRMRFLYKALQKMPVLDYRTQAWVERFNAEKATKLGNVALHKQVQVPVRPKETVDDEGKKIITPWTTRSAPTLQVFRYPKVRKAVIETLGASSDPSGYVIGKLDKWLAVQIERPSDPAIAGAENAYAQLLFGIWGSDLSQFTENLVTERFEDLDIPG